MSDLLAVFMGLILGAIIMYWLSSFFRKKIKREQTEKQSVILLNTIKKVCRLISVEGDFSEIYQYENTKERFMSLVSSTKKALIVINAKAHIGYDLKKVVVRSDLQKKKIYLDHFPQPEILSIEPELQFYDIQNGLFNSFSPKDLTTLNQEAKQHIREKIPDSGLMDTAKREAIETVHFIETIVKTIGWKLDYSALEIDTETAKQIAK